MPLDPNCVEKIELFVTASALAKVQNFSNTDAFAVAYFKDHKTNQLVRIGNTEVIMDNQSPNWTASFPIDYMFEVAQEITVRVFHLADKKHALTEEAAHHLLGEVTFLVATLMRSTSQTLALDLAGAKHAQGKVSVRGEILTNTRDEFVVTFSGAKLANKDGMFGTSDPFLEISRLNEDGSYTAVWKNNKIDNSLNPHWAEAKIPMTTLCNGDIDRPLRVAIYDWDSNGKHQSMGVVSTSVRAMLSNGPGMDVVEADKKAKNKSYVNSGHLTAANVHIEHHPTFSEFIAGGCEISMVVAIDFTGSNGDPESPQSLHFVDPSGRYNAYQDAISAVGSVLQQYDSDKMYSVYGFGARVRLPDGQFSPVQHCFPVYGGGVEVAGVDGILKAYKECLGNVMLSGPTLFAPLIGGAASIAGGANVSQERQKYTILLILTDGVINDEEQTIAAIVEASSQPLSIIIVGVGAADFSDMAKLDSDKQLLRSGSRTAARDVVQFVTYREAASRGSSVLAQQVLAEVPNQVLKFMELRNILPNKRK